MPCLSGQFNPAIGILLTVAVFPAGGIAAAAAAATAAAAGGGATLGQIAAHPGLLDTGADVTCVSPTIAQTLGLVPVGMRPMVSANQMAPANVYLVDLALIFGAQAFGVPGLQVLEFLPAQGSPYQLLIGRDIICRGALAVSFDGHYTFSI